MRESTTLESFLKKVYPEPNTGCWLWGGASDRKGYGITSFTAKRMTKAHRISYYLHFGDFNESLSVLHRCDTPACVNPDHLFLGTHQDNMDDCSAKNRIIKGRDQWKSKLTEDDVRTIRTLRASGTIYRVISEMFNISIHQVFLITTYKNWKHVS